MEEERKNSLCPSVHCDQQEGERAARLFSYSSQRSKVGFFYFFFKILLLFFLPIETEMFRDTNLKLEEKEIILNPASLLGGP